MNDFDFEELDKAVNQLATKTTDEHGAAPTDAPLTIKPRVPEPIKPESRPEPVAVSAPEPPKPTEESKTESIPVAQPQKHPSRLTETRPRNRGSFMDIVPPANRKPSGRVGVSIQPISKPEDIVPTHDPEPTPKVELKPIEEPPKPELQDETPSPAEPAQKVEAPKTDSDVSWPDPLDFHDTEPAKKEEKPEEPEPAEPADAASPFLAEAKVEKRPLGAFSNFRAKPDEKPEPAPQPEPTPELIKDELTPEKDGTFKEPEAPTPEKAPPAPQSEPKEKEEPSKPDLHNAAMMSIPQQYHAEAKVTDKTTRPIFDTKEYHPPLLEAATGEHRGGGSMWGKLFIALVVLALLGVAGYFAYLYVMQR